MNTPSPALTDRPCGMRAKANRVKTAALAIAVFGTATASALAQNRQALRNPTGAGGDRGRCAGQTYFGPQPSQVQRESVGEYQNLKSGKIRFRQGNHHPPSLPGCDEERREVWYIVTDTDDKGNAEQLGLNYSPKLTFADVGRAVRKANLDTSSN